MNTYEYDEDYFEELRQKLCEQFRLEIEMAEDDKRHEMMEFYADMQGEPLMRRYGK